MISYRLATNKNEASEYYKKYYAIAVTTDTCDLSTLSERIERNCSMKKSDVNAVLIELVEVMKDELQAGHKVTIDGLGSFKIGIKGTYADTADTYSVATNITGYRVNFRPECSRIKVGTTTDAETGKVKAKYAYTSDFTTGITAQEY